MAHLAVESCEQAALYALAHKEIYSLRSTGKRFGGETVAHTVAHTIMRHDPEEKARDYVRRHLEIASIKDAHGEPVMRIFKP